MCDVHANGGSQSASNQPLSPSGCNKSTAVLDLRTVQWVAHASLLWELHKQEVSKLNDSRRERERQHARSLASLKEQLEEERERTRAAVVEEREASKAQLRAAQEVSGVKVMRTDSNEADRNFLCPSPALN